MNAEVAKEGVGEPRAFATTRWSLILSAASSESGEQKARQALDELCRTYWRPVFSFVCRHGYAIEDAQDLTQDFFVKILEGNWLQHADRNRGRFRSLLLNLDPNNVPISSSGPWPYSNTQPSTATSSIEKVGGSALQTLRTNHGTGRGPFSSLPGE